MLNFKNGIIVEDKEDINEIYNTYGYIITYDGMMNFVMEIKDITREKLEKYSYDDMMDLIKDEEYFIFYDFGNGFELWYSSGFYGGIFYNTEKIDENELPFLFIDYNQFNNLCDMITIVLPEKEIDIKYSLYGNIIEVLDDDGWYYINVIKDIIKGNVTKILEEEIDKTLPYFKYHIKTCIYNGFIVSNSEAFCQ